MELSKQKVTTTLTVCIRRLKHQVLTHRLRYITCSEGIQAKTSGVTDGTAGVADEGGKRLVFTKVTKLPPLTGSDCLISRIHSDTNGLQIVRDWRP